MNELLPWSRGEETAETPCMLPSAWLDRKLSPLNKVKLCVNSVAYKDRWRGDGDSVLVCYYFSHTFLV